MFRRVVLASALSVCVACGSRSGLLDSTDAGPPLSCAPATPDGSCAQAILTAPAGTQAWEAVFDVGDQKLIGPAAADASGATYYLSAKDSLYVEKVFSVDACGKPRWTEDATDDLFYTSGYLSQVIVSEDRLLRRARTVRT